MKVSVKVLKKGEANVTVRNSADNPRHSYVAFNSDWYMHNSTKK